MINENIWLLELVIYWKGMLENQVVRTYILQESSLWYKLGQISEIKVKAGRNVSLTEALASDTKFATWKTKMPEYIMI